MSDYFDNYFKDMHATDRQGIHSCPDLIDCIQKIGFLPLLESGVQGFCAEGMMAEECRFIQFDDGSWNGRCGRGKAQQSKKATAFTANFSTARQDSSVLIGGPTSTIGDGAKIPNWNLAA